MSDQYASLRIDIDSRTATTAAAALDKLAKSSQKAESATQAMQRAAGGMTATEAATKRLAAAHGQVRDELGRTSSAAESATQRVQKFVGGLNSSASLLSRSLGAVSAALVAREVIQAADAYSNLQAKLALATNGFDAMQQAQADLFRVAQASRTSFGGTVDLFAALSRSTRQLGVSQNEVVKVTEAINRAIAVSGTNAQSAAAALVQLGQGFASGVLRGEELNSVLEQAPRLAQAIADGLGVNLGKLRELGQAGVLTSERVFGALQSQSEKLRQEFERMPATVGGALTTVGNSVTALIGKLDQATGATASLAKGLSSVATIFDLVRTSGASPDSSAGIERLQIERNLLGETVEMYRRRGLALRDSSPEKQRIAEIDKLIDAYRRQRAAEAAITDSENARRFGRFDAERQASTAAALGNDKGKKPRTTGASEAQRYLESLQQQLAHAKDLTLAEQALAAIQQNRISGLTPKLKEQILLTAQLADQAKRQADQLKAEEQQERDRDAFLKQAAAEELRLRERISAATQQRAQALAGEIDEMIRANEAWRDEIALLQGGEAARRAIEKARNDSALALKEETLAQLENAGASAEEISALQQQIELLRQRRELMGQRNAASDAAAMLEQQRQQAQMTRDAIQGTLGQSLYQALNGDFGRIGKSWQDMLHRMVAEALAAKVMMALFGDGSSSGGGGVGGAAASALAGLFGGGRATGGPVQAGRLYEINERGGPGEILSAGGRQYLLAAQSGTVKPNSGGGGGKTIQINVNQTFAPGTSRETTTQAAAAATEMLRRGSRNL